MEKKKVALLFLLAFLPLAVSTHSPTLTENLRTQILTQASSFLQLSGLLMQKVTGSVFRWEDLFRAIRERERLREELLAVQRELVQLREASRENERLKELLDFKSQGVQKSIACQIIGRDLSLLSHSVVLNKGLGDGIQPEMPMVTQAGLAGKVIEAGSSVARGILLTDIESRVSGLIQRTRESGLVVGDGSSFLEMQYIDLKADVKPGDAVISSGLGSVYPKGILIGWVEDVKPDQSRLHLVAKLKPAVSFSRLEEVLCLDSLSAS